MFKMIDSCGAIAGGAIKDLSFNCRVVVRLVKRLDRIKHDSSCVSLKIYYNTESPQDLRIKAISFSRSSEEY